jgi:hypothetical protein
MTIVLTIRTLCLIHTEYFGIFSGIFGNILLIGILFVLLGQTTGLIPVCSVNLLSIFLPIYLYFYIATNIPSTLLIIYSLSTVSISICNYIFRNNSLSRNLRKFKVGYNFGFLFEKVEVL